jgi:hypothetical protein
MELRAAEADATTSHGDIPTDSMAEVSSQWLAPYSAPIPSVRCLSRGPLSAASAPFGPLTCEDERTEMNKPSVLAKVGVAGSESRRPLHTQTV